MTWHLTLPPLQIFDLSVSDVKSRFVINDVSSKDHIALHTFFDFPDISHKIFFDL